MTRNERRIFVAFARSEFRRLSRYKGEERTSAPIVYLPENMVVREVPQAQQAMSLPACLCSPDTEAGRERRANVLAGKPFWLHKVMPLVDTHTTAALQ